MKKKRYACITGAASGIGYAFAKQLDRRGYNLILVGRNESKLKEVSKKFTNKCEFIVCDLSDTQKCIELGRILKERNFDVFINNAGFGDLGAFYETDLDKDLSMINVNVTAMHILTKYVLQNFMKKDSGYILNVASSAGLMPGGPYMSTYYASKAYITSMTTAIWEELKENHSNVSISMLCPGPVDTNFNNVANVNFALPGIQASYCVSYALKQMFRRKLTIVPSLTMKIAVTGSRFLPRRVLASITARQQHKKM